VESTCPPLPPGIHHAAAWRGDMRGMGWGQIISARRSARIQRPVESRRRSAGKGGGGGIQAPPPLVLKLTKVIAFAGVAAFGAGAVTVGQGINLGIASDARMQAEGSATGEEGDGGTGQLILRCKLRACERRGMCIEPQFRNMCGVRHGVTRKRMYWQGVPSKYSPMYVGGVDT